MKEKSLKKGARSEVLLYCGISCYYLDGLNRIIYYSLKYKTDKPHTGIWTGNYKLADNYFKESKLHYS